QKQHSTIVHKKTIRSGQQIYAKNADLIIIGSVSPGAEIIADGSIYLYGVLRGKAIAGANNNKDARLLINDFQGELIAIAGKYKTADSIAHNTGLHIYLADDTLIIDEI
ncbi:MAG: septum site-determining protein MinC, partial [Legionellales bacterium]|nr:septum site-determining protein MinC [Legionellales bacterium]